ncbi:MAG: formyltetrahydrofolate deformylase, partial [Burkholderiales bacterium]
MSSSREFILTLSCRDTKGIVYAVSGLLFEAGCNILDSQQFGDVLSEDATGLFFMRVHFEASPELGDAQALVQRFAPLRERFAMRLHIHPLSRRPKLLLMVSRHGHCLNDLLFRCQSGQLDADIAAVVSNHPDFAELCASHGVPF